MMDSLAELRDLIRRHAPDRRVATPIPRVTLLHSPERTLPQPATYEAVLCIVAQGRKRVILGDQLFEYDTAKYLVSSIHVPVTGEICEASREAPYLAVTIGLSPAMLASMLLECPDASQRPVAAGMAVSSLTEDLVDPVVRLLRLLDRPADIPMLAPLVEREILYRLLQGEQGPMLRQIALADSRLSQVSRAIEWIRRNYREPLRIEAVAAVANMSASSFHRHFKAVTAMSPLQFQKQIRLQEARRLLLSRGADAARVGFSVGYGSPSQFSREYSRLFGAPPARDAARLRATDGEGVAEPA